MRILRTRLVKDQLFFLDMVRLWAYHGGVIGSLVRHTLFPTLLGWALIIFCLFIPVPDDPYPMADFSWRLSFLTPYARAIIVFASACQIISMILSAATLRKNTTPANALAFTLSWGWGVLVGLTICLAWF